MFSVERHALHVRCLWQTKARTDTGMEALFSTIGLPSFCFLILVDCRAVSVLHNLFMAILCFIYSPPSPTAFLVCKYVVSKEEKLDGMPILLDIVYRLCTYSNKYSDVSHWCLSSAVCNASGLRAFKEAPEGGF